MKEEAKQFWKWLRGDSWGALLVSLFLIFLLIRFIIFPVLSILTGTALPLVIVESCSMYHSQELDKILENGIYEDYGITLNDTESWPFKNGLSKGDIIFVLGDDSIEVGDVIIFDAGIGIPIIHRVIGSGMTVTTKGDNNYGLIPQEQDIKKEQIIGRAVFRVPALGWIKLIFFEPSRSPSDRGFCL